LYTTPSKIFSLYLKEFYNTTEKRGIKHKAFRRKSYS